MCNRMTASQANRWKALILPLSGRINTTETCLRFNYLWHVGKTNAVVSMIHFLIFQPSHHFKHKVDRTLGPVGNNTYRDRLQSS